MHFAAEMRFKCPEALLINISELSFVDFKSQKGYTVNKVLLCFSVVIHTGVPGGAAMARAIGIGNQDFEKIRQEGYFYIDKTRFIRIGGTPETV